MQHLFLRVSVRSSHKAAQVSWRAPRQQIRNYVAFQQDTGEPTGGTTTPAPPIEDPDSSHSPSKSPFYFLAGYSLFAKRPSRPFPPPFLSLPSSSFSDALSTHDRSVDKRHQQQWYDGELIRGITNGDDAVLVSERLIAANDGVGAWAQKERGHAA